MSELKRAFDIPGFCEGETKIKLVNSSFVYFMKNGCVYFEDLFGERNTLSSISYNELSQAKWSPVPDPSKKEKWYRHEFWMLGTCGADDDYRRVTTKRSWREFVKDRERVEHISTEEYDIAPSKEEVRGE